MYCVNEINDPGHGFVCVIFLFCLFVFHALQMAAEISLKVFSQTQLLDTGVFLLFIHFSQNKIKTVSLNDSNVRL